MLLNRYLNLVSYSCAIVISAYFINLSVQLLSIHNTGVILLSLLIILLFVKAYNSNTINKIKYQHICIGAFFLYIAWSLFVLTIPISDFKDFYVKAGNFSRTGSLLALQDSKSTGVTLYYSLWFKLLGQGYFSIYLGSALAWSLSGALLYKASKSLQINQQTSKLFLSIFLFSPSTIFFSSVMSSESVYVLLFSISIYCTSKYIDSENSLYLALFSISAGILFITRTNGGVMIIAALISLPILVKFIKNINPIKIIFAVFIPFVLVLFLQGLLNYKVKNDFYVTSSKWGSFLLLTGTYKPSNGGYSKEQLELAGFIGDNKTSHEEASKVAFSIAVERITSSPIDFFTFALTDKVQRLWSNKWALGWSTNKSLNHEEIKPLRYNLNSVDSAYLVASILVFTVWIIFNIKRKLLFIMMLPMAGLIVIHIFVEVQGRYQIPMMPFIYLGVAIAISDLSERFRRIHKNRNI